MIVALGVHAAVAVWASRAERESAEGPVGAVETPIEVEVEAPVAEPPTSVETPSETTLPRLAVATAEAARSTTPALGGDVVAETLTTPTAASAEPTPSGTWTFSPSTAGSTSRVDPLSSGALGAAVRAGVRETVAEDTRERQEFALKHVIPLFTPRDLETGMVPGGALVNLARDLVRRSRAPDNGRALLQFDTDGAGVVSSVRVLDASSSRPEWDEVASQIAAAARSKPALRVPDGARGLSVTLEVTSAMKTVSGGAMTDDPLAKALSTVMNPADAVIDAKTPAQRVVASHVVDVRAF